MKFQNPILINWQRAINQKMKRAINRNNKIISKNLPGNLFIILYQLSKFEALSCNGF